MLHCVKVHLEPLEVDKQQLWSLLDHHLASGHLLRIAAFAVKLVAKFEELLAAELLEAVT